MSSIACFRGSGDEWAPVEGRPLEALCTALGVVIDAYGSEEAEEKLKAVQAARGLQHRDESELSVAVTGEEQLKAIEGFSKNPHWYKVEAFHFVADGACTFVFYPRAGDGEAEEAKDASDCLKLVCSKGAVVIALPLAKHSMVLDETRFLKMVGLYAVDPESIEYFPKPSEGQEDKPEE